MVLVLLADDGITCISITHHNARVYATSDSVGIRVESFPVRLSWHTILFSHALRERIVGDAYTVSPVQS